MNPVIEISNLKIGYPRSVVHEAIDAQLFAGRLTSLLGLNGAGKSTLLRTVCGFQPALGGEILINGRHLKEYSQGELSRIIGVVLTEKTNAGGITVAELVALGRHPYTGFFGRLTTADRRIVDEAIEAVGMNSKADCYVSELSDGERQKVMIAKVLAQECPVILLDEPTAYLDVTSRIETISLLHRLAAGQNKAVLLSTHDLDLALQMSDCLWLLDPRRPLTVGAPEDIILNGDFELFFDREGIKFDPSTGKLTSVLLANPIAVEGDFNTSYWVGNALIRNGFRPVSVAESDVRIVCRSPRDISLYLPDGHEITAVGVAEAVEALITERKQLNEIGSM
ncbi:MAG: ABC transporter ATP-binding protein [Tannerella sp.]|jgi:iron complex transport system ATP-binding protein|nr:ABC transporter ATP-binding protein [Tannerella sp.]